ncbi:hypothetical protein M3Y96_00378800 [Aphelenchoides besseyi]|nr:hypothetical protein M3Y96_00378800 [Aphelenchoides besseyi]
MNERKKLISFEELSAMWSFIRGFLCGHYQQPKVQARALSPPENSQKQVSTGAVHESGDHQAMSPTLKLQKHFEDKKIVGNEAEIERVKVEFLHDVRPQNAAPMSNEEIQEYQKEHGVLQLKSQFLQIRPDSRFAEANSPVHNSNTRAKFLFIKTRLLHQNYAIEMNSNSHLPLYTPPIYDLQYADKTAGIANLEVYGHFYYGLYPILLSFLVYIAAYHSFRKKFRWILIVYFLTEILFILYNVALAFLMFSYSAHSFEISFLNMVPEHVAELIAILEILLIPCQLVSFFIMVQNLRGHKLKEFLPQNQLERRVVNAILSVIVVVTLISLIYIQLIAF